MTRPPRFLGGVNSSSSSFSSEAEPPEAVAVESDFVVIFAALLCALICVVGLIAVGRCAWLRRGGASSGGLSTASNKGLNKKVLQSLPKLIYDSDANSKLAVDCAICLAEYANGDEIRVLPLCGHGFHVNCVDTWLGSHSSCPSCRQILVKAKHRVRRGEIPSEEDSGGGGGRRAEAELEAREDGVASGGFSPF